MQVPPPSTTHVITRQCRYLEYTGCFFQPPSLGGLTSGGSRGAPPVHAPPWVQILSFWHTNFSKRSCLGSWHPSTRSMPPYGKSWIRYCLPCRSHHRASRLRYHSKTKMYLYKSELGTCEHGPEKRNRINSKVETTPHKTMWKFTLFTQVWLVNLQRKLEHNNLL